MGRQGAHLAPVGREHVNRLSTKIVGLGVRVVIEYETT